MRTIRYMSDTVPSITFEDLRQENGVCYWWARDLMLMLGYDSWVKFEKVLDRAVKTCMNLDQVSHYKEFRFEDRDLDGVTVQDCKLSRFACFLVAMNGDGNLPQVAQAQAYFASLAEGNLSAINSEDVSRLSVRKELADGNTSLSSSFKRAGGLDFAMFNYSGFVGMYNAPKGDVARRKGVGEKDFYERIGRAELAANLFRVTMTEERITNKSVRGQRNLETAHNEVGREIRELVLRNTGRPPEALPVSEKAIPQVKKHLKGGRKALEAVDSPKPSKTKKLKG